jgi:hypothetical protein
LVRFSPHRGRRLGRFVGGWYLGWFARGRLGRVCCGWRTGGYTFTYASTSTARSNLARPFALGAIGTFSRIVAPATYAILTSTARGTHSTRTWHHIVFTRAAKTVLTAWAVWTFCASSRVEYSTLDTVCASAALTARCASSSRQFFTLTVE